MQKNNEKVILSICIPTYNRMDELYKCIKSIETQTVSKEFQYEILISDNCSSDKTGEVFKNYPGVKYYRQEENLGAESNFLFLFKEAKGKYIWILGDDEELCNNSLSKIESIISKSYNILILNYVSWHENNSNIYKLNYKIKSKKIKNSEELLKVFGPELSFISSVIISRELLKNFPYSIYEEIKITGFGFFYAIYHICNKFDNFYYSDFPYFRNRISDKTSYDWDKYFIQNFPAVIEKLETIGYPKKIINKAKNQILRKYIAPKIRDRLINNYSITKSVILTFNNYKFSIEFWVYVFPLILIPSRVLKIIKSIYYFKKNA